MRSLSRRPRRRHWPQRIQGRTHRRPGPRRPHQPLRIRLPHRPHHPRRQSIPDRCQHLRPGIGRPRLPMELARLRPQLADPPQHRPCRHCVLAHPFPPHIHQRTRWRHRLAPRDRSKRNRQPRVLRPRSHRRVILPRLPTGRPTAHMGARQKSLTRNTCPHAGMAARNSREIAAHPAP